MLTVIVCLALFACNKTQDDTAVTTDKEKETAAQTETEPADTAGITENGGTATVKTDVISYTAKGYDGINDGKFCIKSGFCAEIDGDFDEFNRLTLKYCAEKAIRLTFTYYLNSTVKQEPFFAEASSDGSFSCLIGTYLDGDLAKGPVTVSAETCTGETAEFMIYGLSAESVKYSAKTARYIENAKFKLGVKLNWGGAVNYLEDKTANISGLKNLINQHDTGRLLQQSYYGVRQNDEFTPGTSFGQTWRYNPVQGGDQFQHESRLIDLTETDNSIYVKSQPLDWAKNNYLMPCYMENTYAVYGDYIRVDNRFVDFSGYDHPVAGQELPAMYVVNYLNRFYRYDGDDPWTDEELFFNDDLKFWGPYPDECDYPFDDGNTETWGAFINPDDNFGIGLYVPNVDRFTAGRNDFNNSKSDVNDFTNYMCATNKIKIIPFTPFEYSYLITTGSADEIRAVFKREKDFTDNAGFNRRFEEQTEEGKDEDVEFVFGSEQSIAVFNIANNNTEVAYSTEQNAAEITCTGGDPQIGIFYSNIGYYTAENKNAVEFTYMIPNENRKSAYKAELFLCTGDTAYPQAGKSVFVDLIKDGEYHTVTVDLTENVHWSKEINEIRFDYFNGAAAGDKMYVRSFKLLSK